MLSTRLVTMIEDHAEELTRGVIRNLKTNSLTAHFQHMSYDEIHHRTYDVYRNLGHWLSHKSDEAIEATYSELGKKRFSEGVPLSQVVYGLILIKEHLRDYVQSSGLLDSALELYQEQELRRLVGHFFDRAIYFTVRGYESQTGHRHSKSSHTNAA
jgi:hypothetical protein